MSKKSIYKTLDGKQYQIALRGDMIYGERTTTIQCVLLDRLDSNFHTHRQCIDFIDKLRDKNAKV